MTEQHQVNFDDIKCHLCCSPVLHPPISGGRFILCSDTSQTHTGSAMWQFQKGIPCLISYASKSLPPTCKNYSITELEMFRLIMNMHSWNHLIGNVDFDCATDHIAVVRIMKAKDKPSRKRIQRFLEKLFRYKFNLYYVKGKDLILTDFLSCINTNDTNPSELILISFVNMIKNDDQDRLNIVIRCGTRLAGLETPKVHSDDKSLDPNQKPEHQKIKPIPRLARQPLLQNSVVTKPPIKPKSSAQQASQKLIDKSCKTLLKSQRDVPPKLTMAVQTEIQMDTTDKFDPLMALEKLKANVKIGNLNQYLISLSFWKNH